jgi:hypothetical protein
MNFSIITTPWTKCGGTFSAGKGFFPVVLPALYNPGGKTLAGCLFFAGS